jgi:hypothetical protein
MRRVDRERPVGLRRRDPDRAEAVLDGRVEVARSGRGVERLDGALEAVAVDAKAVG